MYPMTPANPEEFAKGFSAMRRAKALTALNAVIQIDVLPTVNGGDS